MTILFASAFLGCGKHIEENPVSDFEYTENEDGGITITKYIGERTEVVIPRKINGKKITAIGERAFEEDTERNRKTPEEARITYIDIPDTVTFIGGWAFSSCLELQTIIFPRNLEIIDKFAFSGCKPSELDFPESLKEIREGAFMGISIESVKLLASVKYGIDVFSGCDAKSVEIEEGVTEIPTKAFFGCMELKNVKIPNTIETIGFSAFVSCNELESITLNEGLKKIDEYAFAFCEELEEIIIPKSVEEIGNNAFGFCIDLESLKFDGNAPQIVPPEGTLCDGTLCDIYYHEGAKGFDTAEWSKHIKKIW